MDAAPGNTLSASQANPNWLTVSIGGDGRINGLRNQVTTNTRSFAATLQADPGLIFDKLNMIIHFGSWGNDGSFSYSEMDWNIIGGTYSGPLSSGPIDGIGHQWNITGPSTGEVTQRNYRGDYRREGDSVATGGFYNIGASSFSVDVSEYDYLFS
jgi:hypothetical protein